MGSGACAHDFADRGPGSPWRAASRPIMRPRVNVPYTFRSGESRSGRKWGTKDLNAAVERREARPASQGRSPAPARAGIPGAPYGAPLPLLGGRRSAGENETKTELARFSAARTKEHAQLIETRQVQTAPCSIPCGSTNGMPAGGVRLTAPVDLEHPLQHGVGDGLARPARRRRRGRRCSTTMRSANMLARLRSCSIGDHGDAARRASLDAVEEIELMAQVEARGRLVEQQQRPARARPRRRPAAPARARNARAAARRRTSVVMMRLAQVRDIDLRKAVSTASSTRGRAGRPRPCAPLRRP